MRPEWLVPAALALDALVGDPANLPHPTRAMGWLATAIEGLFRREGGKGSRARSAGALGWFLVVGPSVLAALGLVEGLGFLAGLCAGAAGLKPETWATAGRALASLYLLYAAIAPRDLAAHALRVARALREGPEEGRLAAGRRAVSMIVGRDVERLDEAGVIRAAVESVAESAIDGICAPLFWAFLLGPAGAIAYRAANTLDSLWGHTNERYLDFGRFAARADDALTWPAARCGFAVSILAAALLALVPGTRCRPGRALRLGLRDRRKHASPNSAWLEASFAGALGVELAGPAWYSGELLPKPWIGEARRPVELSDIGRSVLLMYATTLLFAAAGIALSLLLRSF